MSDQNPYYQGNQQDPYSDGQYRSQYQQPQQQPQTVYGSYGEQVPYQQPVPQSAPYPPVQQPYPPIQTPGYGQQQAPYYVAPYPVSEPGSALAIAGFVLGIISILTSWFPFFGIVMPIVGIVLSALGRRSVSKRLLATIGLVLSIIAVAISLCVIASIFISATRHSTPTY